MGTKKIIFFIFYFQSLVSYSQVSTEYSKIGKWANEEFAVEIRENVIIILNKDEGGWKNFHNSKDEFRTVETIVEDFGFCKNYVASSYTYLRRYNTDGGETSIENAEFKIITIKGVTDNSIEFSITDSWLESQDNIHPKTEITEKIKTELNSKKITLYNLNRVAQ